MYALATACYVLGMLSKPTAMVTPALAVVMDRWVLGRSWKQIGRSPWPWVWFALAIPCMVIATRVQPGEALDPIPLWIRPLIAADSLAFYLWKLVWPASLAVEYGHKPSWVLEQGWAYWTWILPVAVGVALWTTRKRSPLLLAGGMMVAIALSPVLGLTPFHFQVFTTVADHYMYIPMLGVSLAGGSVVARHESKTVLIVAGLVLAALGVRSFAAARVWNDNISLFTNALEVNPRSWLAADDLGTACVLRARAAGSVDEVIRWLEKAEDAYRQMVAIDRSHSRGTRKLVKTLSESAAFLGNAQRDDEAIAKCREFISITDGARAARMNLTGPAMAAGVRRVHGGALLRRGRISEAIEQFRVAVSLRPNDPAARKDLEVALEALNHPTTRPAPEPPTQPSKRD